jgi:hypothetical protein
MAASVAAQLSKENDVKVEIARGGLGEFSVFIDGQKVIDTNRFWYPAPGRVVARTRALLNKQKLAANQRS